MRILDNEGKACDAVLRVLEERTGKVRCDISHPKKVGTEPSVELWFRLGTQNYAMEHTQIEAFEGQIYFGKNFSDLIEPITKELSGKLPKPGVYRLYFPIDTRLGVKPDQLPRVRDALIAWIREHALRLHNKNPTRPTRDRNPYGLREQYRAQPPDFPYEVVLHREAHWSYSERHEGVLTVARFAPEDVELQRAQRLRKAMKDKCPKLQRCKMQGARTILILEDGDIALSNHILIGDGLAEPFKERSDLPDEIYLVETTVNEWDVRLLKYEDNYLPEKGYWGFDSTDLMDITAFAEDQNQQTKNGCR